VGTTILAWHAFQGLASSLGEKSISVPSSANAYRGGRIHVYAVYRSHGRLTACLVRSCDREDKTPSSSYLCSRPLEKRYNPSTTFQCFAPWHFLLTESIVTRFFGWVLPDKRPMDNMKAGWSLPQEDEFALMNLGAPTPYTYMMFPQHGFIDENTLAAESFEPEQLQRWKYLFDWFLKALTYKTKKPLILKSPPHTGRIAILREMYPDAKFIHIVRDPRKLFPSTIKLWKSLEFIQGLQGPHTDEELQPFVFDCLNRMYDAFEIGRQGLKESQIIDVRYEELVANPTAVVESIYQQLDLGGFDAIRDSLMKRTQDEKEYKTNSFGLDEATETLVLQNWKTYAERYGYS
jgi:omega-hydroxy-beta-dihydromenaquinone-9 sulfotransferase